MMIKMIKKVNKSLPVPIGNNAICGNDILVFIFIHLSINAAAAHAWLPSPPHINTKDLLLYFDNSFDNFNWIVVFDARSRK